MATRLSGQQDKQLLASLYRALRHGDGRAVRFLNRSSGRGYSAADWLHMLAPACQRLGLEPPDSPGSNQDIP